MNCKGYFENINVEVNSLCRNFYMLGHLRTVLAYLVVNFGFNIFQRYGANQGQQQHDFTYVHDCKEVPLGIHGMMVSNLEGVAHLDFHQFDLPQHFEQNFYTGFGTTDLSGDDGMHHISSYLLNMCPPPSAFLGPKCALWDCPRPAQAVWIGVRITAVAFIMP